MKNTRNKKPQPPKAEPARPLDIYFAEYDKAHKDPTNKFINYIAAPLMVFSVLGLLWSIPFPHLNFLGQYKDFFNWASVLIGVSVYFYYRLSPVLSYLMLFLLFICSFGAIELDQWQQAGGPSLGPVCLVIFILARGAQFIGYKIEGINPSFSNDLKFMVIGPIWVLHFILKRSAIKY